MKNTKPIIVIKFCEIVKMIVGPTVKCGTLRVIFNGKIGVATSFANVFVSLTGCISTSA